MRAIELRQNYIAGMVWSIWATYWTSLDQLIPPLHFLRMGGGEDFIFVSGATETALDGFLASVKASPELAYVKQGDWWLPTSNWYGHWTVFQVSIRPALDGVERWRSSGKPNGEQLPVSGVETSNDHERQNAIPALMRSEASKSKRGWGRWWSRSEGSA